MHTCIDVKSWRTHMRDAHVYRQNVGSVHLRMRVSFTAESTESGSLQDLIGYFFPKAIFTSFLSDFHQDFGVLTYRLTCRIWSDIYIIKNIRYSKKCLNSRESVTDGVRNWQFSLYIPLKNQNFDNRASSCFKLAKIKPRAKMSWSWDIFYVFLAQSPPKKNIFFYKSLIFTWNACKKILPKKIFFIRATPPQKNGNFSKKIFLHLLIFKIFTLSKFHSPMCWNGWDFRKKREKPIFLTLDHMGTPP